MKRGKPPSSPRDDTTARVDGRPSPFVVPMSRRTALLLLGLGGVACTGSSKGDDADAAAANDASSDVMGPADGAFDADASAAHDGDVGVVASVDFDIHRLDGLSSGTVVTGNTLLLPATGPQAIPPGKAATSLRVVRDGVEVACAITELDGRWGSGNLIAVRLGVQTSTPTGKPDRVTVQWGLGRALVLPPGDEAKDIRQPFAVEADPTDPSGASLRTVNDVVVWRSFDKIIVRVPARTRLVWDPTVTSAVAAAGSRTEYQLFCSASGSLLVRYPSYAPGSVEVDANQDASVGRFAIVAGSTSSFRAGTTSLASATIDYPTESLDYANRQPYMPAAILLPATTEYMCKTVGVFGPQVSYADTQTLPQLAGFAYIAAHCEALTSLSTGFHWGFGRVFRAVGFHVGSASYDAAASLYEHAHRYTGVQAVDWWIQAASTAGVWRTDAVAARALSDKFTNGPPRWVEQEWRLNSRTLAVDYLMRGRPDAVVGLDFFLERALLNGWHFGGYDIQNDADGRMLGRIAEASIWSHVLGRPFVAGLYDADAIAQAQSGVAASKHLDRVDQCVRYLSKQQDATSTSNAGRILVKAYRPGYRDPTTGKYGQHIMFQMGLMKLVVMETHRITGSVPQLWLDVFDRVTAYEFGVMPLLGLGSSDAGQPVYFPYLQYGDLGSSDSTQPQPAVELAGLWNDWLGFRALTHTDAKVAARHATWLEQSMRAQAPSARLTPPLVSEYYTDAKACEQRLRGYGRSFGALARTTG